MYNLLRIKGKYAKYIKSLHLFSYKDFEYSQECGLEHSQIEYFDQFVIQIT